MFQPCKMISQYPWMCYLKKKCNDKLGYQGCQLGLMKLVENTKCFCCCIVTICILRERHRLHDYFTHRWDHVNTQCRRYVVRTHLVHNVDPMGYGQLTQWHMWWPLNIDQLQHTKVVIFCLFHYRSTTRYLE